MVRRSGHGAPETNSCHGIDATRAPAEVQSVASNAAHAIASFSVLDRRIEDVAKDYANSDVLLADEIFRDMIGRLRFKIRNEDYLRSLKPGTRPSSRSIASLRDAIQKRSGSIFIYDKDAASPALEEMVSLANDGGIPVVALHFARTPPERFALSANGCFGRSTRFMARSMRPLHEAWVPHPRLAID